MKFIRTHQKLMATVMALAMTIPVMGAELVVKETKAIDQGMVFTDDIITETQTYEFYNAKDELVFKTTVATEDLKGKMLISLLNKSDLLTTDDDVSLYRVNE